MSDKTGGPAFPATNHHGHKLEGMTLRDYFAAKTMQGWLANPTATPVEAGIEGASPQDLADVAATFAYIVADSMLKARER